MSDTTLLALTLDQVVAYPEDNPRKDDLDLDSLIASVKAHGVLQPIIVRLNPVQEDGDVTYRVVAGFRRHAAAVLAGLDAIPAVVVTATNLTEIALTENMVRKAMHPVDEFRAFVTMTKEGLKPKAIAKHFSMSELQVRQRLALGKLEPVLLDLWRNGEMEDGAAKILCQAPKEIQLEALRQHQESGIPIRHWEARRLVAAEEIRFDGWQMKFIGGLDAYTAAGGKIDKDLFDDSQRIASPKILTRLVEEKKEAIATEWRVSGWGKVVWQDDMEDHEPDDDPFDGFDCRDPEAVTPQDRPICIAVLCIDHAGGIEADAYRPTTPIERVIDRAGQTGGDDDDADDLSDDFASGFATRHALREEAEETGLNKSHLESMARIRTGFAQVYASQTDNYHTMLALLAFNLLHGGMVSTPLMVKATAYMATPEERALVSEARGLIGDIELPGNPAERFEWLLGLETANVVDIIAACLPRFLDYTAAGGSSVKETSYKQLSWNGQRPQAWTPTVENYFGRFTKAQLIELAIEIIAEAPANAVIGWTGPEGDLPAKVRASNLVKANNWASYKKGELADRVAAVAKAADWRPDYLEPPQAEEAIGTHGSPELDADAAKLAALGQDPGPVLQDLDNPEEPMGSHDDPDLPEIPPFLDRRIPKVAAE